MNNKWLFVISHSFYTLQESTVIYCTNILYYQMYCKKIHSQTEPLLHAKHGLRCKKLKDEWNVFPARKSTVSWALKEGQNWKEGD